MSKSPDIDLVTNDQDLDLLRSVILRPNNELVERQRQQIEQLQAQVAEMESSLTRLSEIEALVVDLRGRAKFVDEVLVDAVENSERQPGVLGAALSGEVEQAIHLSARSEDGNLADALYPVIGPAVRKMISAMFERDNGGKAFTVEQVMLIERSTGLMLASTATTEQALEDADIVSGMIDALTSFVQDAFSASENDGFSDLRVGDLSLLVESGPHAVLASVVRGFPPPEYRHAAAEALEAVHVEFGHDLSTFDGSIDVFEGVSENLGELHQHSKSPANGPLVAVFLVALIGLVLLLFALGGLYQ